MDRRRAVRRRWPPITEGGAATYTVRAYPAPAAPLTVNVRVANDAGRDHVEPSALGDKRVVVPASSSVAYTVATVDDSVDEPDGGVVVDVLDGDGYTPGVIGSGGVVVLDND